MSQTLYDSLLEKWRDFLGDNMYIAYADLIPENEVDDSYDDIVSDFSKEHKYSERIKEMVFYDKWYDTFKDEFYRKLEEEGIKIIHQNPTESDWDFGKKFKFIKGEWYAND